MPSPAAELAAATHLFLRRHEEALASGDGARTREAVEGLLAALESTLPAEVDAIRSAALAAPSGVPPLARLSTRDPPEREAWAHAVLRKRMDEAEGLLLQARLALQNMEAGRGGDAFRFVALLTALRSVLRGLARALASWRDALGACVGEPAAALEPASAFALLRAAREALLAGAPEAATPALRAALVAGLAAPVGAATSVAAARTAWEREGLVASFSWDDAAQLGLALGEPLDEVGAWAALDAVDLVVARAGMARRA